MTSLAISQDHKPKQEKEQKPTRGRKSQSQTPQPTPRTRNKSAVSKGANAPPSLPDEQDLSIVPEEISTLDGTADNAHASHGGRINP